MRNAWLQVGLLALTVAFCVSAAHGAPQGKETAKNTQFTVSIQPDGAYQIAVSGTDWVLDGALASFALQPASTGSDGIGHYRELRARSQDGRSVAIRVYADKPVVLLSDTWLKAGQNDRDFPAFHQLPADASRYSFKRQAFSHYEFGALGEEGPWILFKGSRAVVLSPADHFQISSMKVAENGTATSGINAKIASLPAGFSHGTLLAAGDGVNEAMAAWGAGLQALGGKHAVPNDMDPVLTKFGYWTDNGASYYYKFDPKLGYTGTLLAVKDSFAKMGIPLGYMQLDSWFYPKGTRASWDNGGGDLPFGEDVYRADKKLFPDGLAAFHKQIDMPLVTHARWVSSNSPYRHEYAMSGNVVVDPKFWNETADYLKDSGVITYEQDWLDHNASTDLNVDDPSAFLKNMAASMTAKGLTMQYCMAPPSDYMASSQFQNLATIRTSDDRFERERWDAFLYDSRMATALGALPWADVFMSPETGNLLIATLSSGPVGVGDALGTTSVENVRHVMRADSVIVKPDVGLRPIDRMYTEDAAGSQSPMVADATSGRGDAYYVFAYPRKAADQSATVSLAELGISGSALAYDWNTKTAKRIAPGGSVTIEFDGESHDGGSDKTGSTMADHWGYVVVVPDNGVALIGDVSKFATLGSQRIRVTRRNKGEEAEVIFATGESSVTVTGYASAAPRIKTKIGSAQMSGYDPGTGQFLITVSPGPANKALLSIE